MTGSSAATLIPAAVATSRTRWAVGHRLELREWRARRRSYE